MSKIFKQAADVGNQMTVHTMRRPERRSSDNRLSAEWTAMQDLSRVLLQPGPLEQKLQDALSVVCPLHKGCRSAISLPNPETGKLDVRASLGMPAAALAGLNGITPGEGTCGRAYAEAARFIVGQFDQEPCLTAFKSWAEEFDVRAVYATPFFDSSETVIGVLSLYFDTPHQPSKTEMLLTDACAGTIALFLERARTEGAAASIETRYRTLVQTLSAIVWRFDPANRKFLDVHGWQEFTGLTPPRHTPEEWLAAVYPEDREPVAHSWSVAKKNGTSYTSFHRLLHRDGTYRHMRTVGTPIRNASGIVVEWVGNSEDVTDAHVAKATLAEANYRKDDFLAVLSHELRNPLSATKMAAQLLIESQTGNARIVNIGQVIDRQVEHMSRLVEDLLDVSRIEHGLIVFNAGTVDLAEVVIIASEQVAAMIEAKRHQLNLQISDGPYLVQGDNTRLIQVTTNLLNNAARYTPDNGRITVSLKLVDRTCCLTVTDNGIGIDPSVLPTLFDLYVQAERSNNRSGGGLGLGLALVKSLVELHDGHVSVHSDGKNLGSCFEVCLPLISQAPLP